MKWIELKEGCEMPEIGKPTIWRQEDGSYLSRSIREGDIEDNFCWWKGWVVGFQNCTHWAYVIGPGEEPSTEPNQEEELWNEMAHEMDREGIPVGEIESFMIYWKGKYNISRK